MKYGLILCAVYCWSYCSIAQENPFEQLEYDRAVAYEYQGDGGRDIRFVLQRPSIPVDSSIVLSPTQVAAFETLICGKDGYGANKSDCFDPHFAVAYFQGDSLIASVNVCLMCNYLIADPEVPATRAVVIDAGTESERFAYGFSKTLRWELDAFIQSLGFVRYPLQPGSVFDE